MNLNDQMFIFNHVVLLLLIYKWTTISEKINLSSLWQMIGERRFFGLFIILFVLLLIIFCLVPLDFHYYDAMAW